MVDISAMVDIIGVIIVVAGWIITYRLNITAQNKAFHNQLMNEARKDISNAIREYQRWLEKIYINIVLTGAMAKIDQLALPGNMMEKYRQAIELISWEPSLDWTRMLEEYEILFPETRELRIELLKRHSELHETLFKYAQSLEPWKPKSEWLKAIETAEGQFTTLFDQIALVEDLRIYIQNKSLNKITSNTVPSRQPLDPSRPRVLLQEGMLRIVDNGEKVEN